MTNTTAEIRHGILKAWDNVNWLATVQFTGSLLLNVATIPVSRNIASVEMVVGRRVSVAFFDPSNHTDAILFAVWT